MLQAVATACRLASAARPHDSFLQWDMPPKVLPDAWKTQFQMRMLWNANSLQAGPPGYTQFLLQDPCWTCPNREDDLLPCWKIHDALP
jgi:hypothetical protein